MRWRWPISRLRRTLNVPGLITTVVKRGYRLNAVRVLRNPRRVTCAMRWRMGPPTPWRCRPGPIRDS